jgi:hypothetical protein
MMASDWTFHPPDWQDEQKYPDPKKMTSPEWGWEFLRRNPEFWKDGKALLDLFRVLAATDDPCKIREWYIKAYQEASENHAWSDENIKLYHSSAVAKAHSYGFIFLDKQQKAFCKKWDVSSLLFVIEKSPDSSFQDLDDGELGRPFLLSAGYSFDPVLLPSVSVTCLQEMDLELPPYIGEYHGIPDPRPFSGDDYDAGGVTNFEKYKKGITRLRKARYPAQAAFIFDLRRGWENQQKEVAKIFKGMQKHLKNINALPSQKKFQPDKFTRYLRILDAKICGARHADINDRLLKGDPERCRRTDDPDLNLDALVRDTLKAAEQFRDKNFRLLFYA